MTNLSGCLSKQAPRLLSCALLCLIGCSGDNDPPGAKTDAGQLSPQAKDAASEPDSAADQFLREYAASVCAMYQPCCESEALGYDATGCRDWFAKVTAAYFNGVFRPEAAEDCLRELARQRAADADRCKNELSFDEATLRDKCREAFGAVYKGGAALGTSCLLAADCSFDPEGPVICYGGLCLLNKRGAEGDGPCYLSGRSTGENAPTQLVRCEASDGMYCHRSERVCKAQSEAGEYCPYLSACREGATCTGSRCVALPGPDEPCLNAVRGAGGTCRAGSACDPQTLVCGPPLMEGATCREAEQCASRACMGGVCVKPEFTRALNCTGK